MKRSLSRLLKPDSIALFGGDWAANVITQLNKSGFKGDIWPVHPTREEICNIACFKTIEELPNAPDAAFVGVNRTLTIDIILQLSAMGAGGAICFASGFLESERENAGGAKLQGQLIDAAGDMPVLGPNCYGMLNYLDTVTIWPDQHGGRKVESGVAIIGQSSNILINMTMQKRALPIAYTIAAGNQALVSMSELASHLLDDERVTAIGLYIEGFGDIRSFEAMANKARKLGKQIVAIKAGKSEKAQEATLTHTASLAGSAAAASALFSRLGIIEVESVAVFLEALKLAHTFPPLIGNAISSISCSGGEVGLMSDMARDTHIDFAQFTNPAPQQLTDVLGPLVTISNPLDYHTFIWGDVEKTTHVYSAVFANGFDLNIVVMDIPPSDRCDMSAWESAIQSIIAAKKQTGAKVAHMATLPENLEEAIAERMLAEGIVPLHGMEEAISAIDAILNTNQLGRENTDPALLSIPDKDVGSKILDEEQSKSVLSQYNVPFPASLSAKTPQAISTAGVTLGFPLALKGLGIAHKSEAGAVKLNLKNEQEVLEAARSMTGVTGFLAEEVIMNPVAELLVGITRDVTGLFVLTIGAGGILTELLQDTQSLIIPCSRKAFEDALEKLRINILLKGYRGKPAADREAILDAIMALQAYCIATPELKELDINPLLALPEGAMAVDALIRLEEKP